MLGRAVVAVLGMVAAAAVSLTLAVYGLALWPGAAWPVAVVAGVIGAGVVYLVDRRFGTRKRPASRRALGRGGGGGVSGRG